MSEQYAGTVSTDRCNNDNCNALMIDRGKTHHCPECGDDFPIFRRHRDVLVHNTLGDDYPVKVDPDAGGDQQ